MWEERFLKGPRGLLNAYAWNARQFGTCVFFFDFSTKLPIALNQFQILIMFAEFLKFVGPRG
jgi:hypothetical protein